MEELIRQQYIDGMDYQPVFYKAIALAFPESFLVHDGYYAPDHLYSGILSAAADYLIYSDEFVN